MIHEAYMPVYTWGPDFQRGCTGGSTRGSTRSPRGPKKDTNCTPAGLVFLTVLNSRHSRSGKKMKMLTMMARRRSTSRRSTDIPLLMCRSISPRGPIPHKSCTSSKTHIALQKQNKTSKTRYFKQKGPWQLNGAKANLKSQKSITLLPLLLLLWRLARMCKTCLWMFHCP